MKRKFTAVFLVLMALTVFGTITVQAAPSNSKWVYLTTSDSVKRSGNVYGTFKYYGGTNSSSSKHRVYYESQYSDGNGWKFGNQVLISAGVTLGDTRTPKRTNECLWRLELNPYGPGTKNCTANGYIWYS